MKKTERVNEGDANYLLIVIKILLRELLSLWELNVNCLIPVPDDDMM